MLLILEIILTIRAWRKGWKGLALIPGAIAVGIGMAIGASSGPSGPDMGSLVVTSLVIDGTCIAVLAAMAHAGRATGAATNVTHLPKEHSLPKAA